MGDAVDRFIADLRASPEFADCADSIRDAIAALDVEAGISSEPDAAGLFECVYYVVGHPNHSLREKLEKVRDLVTRRGRQEGRISEIVGWR
jgi:hypothetical protein